MSFAYKAMGFTVPLQQMQQGKGKVVDEGVHHGGNVMLRLDSSRTISFEEACLHTLITGSTGSGKTATFVVPALEALIHEGFGGLTVDIKGALTPYIRAMAKEYGREHDIIELGSELSAQPINRLQGMSMAQVVEFFESMLIGLSSLRDHNRHFHMRGVWFACDCYYLLSIMAVKDVAYTPTLELITDLLSDSATATQFFNTFLEHKDCFISEKYILEDIDAFIKKIQGDTHHLFMMPKANEISNKSALVTYNDQVSYATKTILMALHETLVTPGIMRNFCHVDTDQEPFTMDTIFTQNKIVVLRFSAVSGHTGERFSRHMAEQFYKAVFKHGMNLPKDKYVFACYDEFQSFKDLSGSRYSDASFVDKAREFNAIFIAATQSLSALVDDTGNLSAVEKFVSCCNNRILLYTDDPYTQSMVNRYDENVKLNSLRNEAFVMTYDAKLRQHNHGIDAGQKSYESVKELMARHKSTEPINMDAERGPRKIPKLLKRIATQGEVAVHEGHEMQLPDDRQGLPITGHLTGSVVEAVALNSL